MLEGNITNVSPSVEFQDAGPAPRIRVLLAEKVQRLLEAAPKRKLPPLNCTWSPFQYALPVPALVLVFNTQPPADQSTTEFAQAAGGGIVMIVVRTNIESTSFLNLSSFLSVRAVWERVQQRLVTARDGDDCECCGGLRPVGLPSYFRA